MPVQPQYSFGPLGQPASPDRSRIPDPIDGSARYVRNTPPRTFGVESPTNSCTRLTDISLQNSPLGTMHRKAFDGYSFSISDVPQQFARREPALPMGIILETRSRPETSMRYSPLSGPITHDLNSMGSHCHRKQEFHVANEDFPALPCIPENPLSEQESQEELTAHPPATPTVHPDTTVEEEASASRDKFDLKSYIERLGSSRFCQDYGLLNFEDLCRRSVALHPRAECIMETVSKDLGVAGLWIGINVYNPCKQLREPEDLRTEDPCHHYLNGHKVPVPENDDYYSMADTMKDKLRNPRLHMMDDLTLFFQFYSFTRDTMQLFAADALFQRNWRWNKRISRWCRFERAASAGTQFGVFQVYDPSTNQIQQLSLQYTPLDFEHCPPVIPPPTLRRAALSYVEKL